MQKEKTKNVGKCEIAARDLVNWLSENYSKDLDIVPEESTRTLSIYPKVDEHIFSPTIFGVNEIALWARYHGWGMYCHVDRFTNRPALVVCVH